MLYTLTILCQTWIYFYLPSQDFWGFTSFTNFGKISAILSIGPPNPRAILSLTICNLARLFPLWFFSTSNSIIISHQATTIPNAQTSVENSNYWPSTIDTKLVVYTFYAAFHNSPIAQVLTYNRNSANISFRAQGWSTFKHELKRLKALLSHLFRWRTAAWRGTAITLK